MKLNTLQRSILISLLYIGIFAGLVFLQFSNRERFQENSGAVSVSGLRSDSSDLSAFPTELTVSFKGLGFVFGSGRPVTITDAAGGRTVILPRSYARNSKSVSVELQRGIRLSFEASASGDAFSVSAAFPEGGPAAVEFPYTLSNASLNEVKENLSIKNSGSEYDLDLSAGAKIDIDRHVIALRRDDGRISMVARKAPVKIAAAPGSQAPKPIDPKAFRSLADAYVEKSWRGLKEGRFDPIQEAWSYGGEYRFSEEALMALIAEAHKRGQYGELSGMINGIAKNKSDRLTWKSDVYLGGIVRKTGTLYAQDALERERISKLVQAKDPSVFETPHLTRFALDRAPADLSQRIFAFAASVNADSLSLRQIAGLVACLSEAEAFMPGSANPYLRFEPLIEKKLLAAMVKAPEGYFLALEPSAVDVQAQARLAKALMGWGDARYSETFTGMGQALMQGIFSLSDDVGVLPASLSLNGAQIGGRAGVLAPENVYELVADNPWYPRELSFYKQAGAGVWAWTCAPELKYEGSASGEAAISAVWPLGMTHYLTIFGIEPFSLIQIYDIPYSPDSEFESYNVSGYLYERSSKTLFLKMKHKAEREYVRLTFQ
jgi:hypothetical protein